MGNTTKVSAEDKREAVAMLDAPGVTVHQIAADLGIRPMCWNDGDGPVGKLERTLLVGRKQKFEPVEHPTDNNRQDQIDPNHPPTLRNDGMRSLFREGWFKIPSITHPF
jgi:hypothetical protein